MSGYTLDTAKAPTLAYEFQDPISLAIGQFVETECGRFRAIVRSSAFHGIETSGDANLLLGGTGFVGRHVALAAMPAGHDVAFANRGETDVKAFARNPLIRIDRYGDVVIETSGYTPDSVEACALAVEGRM